MGVDQCTARLQDEQTRCKSHSAASSALCLAHLRERDVSVKEYKNASTRGDTLKAKAIVSTGQLVALKTPEDIQEAIKATEAYREAVQDEARRRVTHTKRFYSDETVDSSDGHHKRVRVLLDRIDTCGDFLVKLRDLQQSATLDGMRTRTTSSKGNVGPSLPTQDREPANKAKRAAVRRQRRYGEDRELAQRQKRDAENRELAERQRRIQADEDAWLRGTRERERAWQTWEREMEWKRQRWAAEEEREMEWKRQRWAAEEERAWREAQRRQPAPYADGGGWDGSAIPRLLFYAVLAYGAYKGAKAIYRWLLPAALAPALALDNLKPLLPSVDRGSIASGDAINGVKETVGNATKGVGTWLTTHVGAAGEALRDAAPGARAAAEGIAADAQKVAEGVVQDAGKWLSTAGESIQHAVPDVLEVHSAAEAVAADAQKIAKTVVQDAGKWVSTAGETIQHAVPNVSEARSAVEAVASDAQKVAGKAAADVGNWVNDGMQSDQVQDILECFGLRRS